MSVIGRRLWTEPAYFFSALVAVLGVLQAVLPFGTTLHAVLAAAVPLIGGAATRSRVSPVRRKHPAVCESGGSHLRGS